MASSLFQPIQAFAQGIPKSHLVQNHSVAIVVCAALSAPILYLVRADYRAWLRLGRGGLPYNPLGWFIQLILTPLRAPRLDTSCYDNPSIVAKSGAAGSKSYLSVQDIPQRKGPRPLIHRWILPHRQADSLASPEWKERAQSFLSILASNSPNQLLSATSVLERGGPALLIQPHVPRHLGARGTRGEIAHLHPLDGSIHVSLAPQDAKLVIERGWGERFGLGGTVMPVTYIMVYAPRPGQGEEEVVERIVTAGMKFMLGEQ